MAEPEALLSDMITLDSVYEAIKEAAKDDGKNDWYSSTAELKTRRR